MFLPTTSKELKKLGWDQADIILVTGDAYIDSPFIGVSIIGRVLEAEGYRVGIIAQPDMSSEIDITALGEPRLFWGVTSGSVDSMISNYTASGKKRRDDDFTPGGINSKRPDRAVIAYSNLIKKHFKNTAPIILGGIEASLRRISHYDFWTDQIRRSILFDAKADILVYGMGEKTIVSLAKALDKGSDWSKTRGICYPSKDMPEDFLILPPHEDVRQSKKAFIEMFRLLYENADPITAKGLCQKQDTRYIVQNPPQDTLTTEELDTIHGLHFERDAHPDQKKHGVIKALETIRFSIPTHRGCYGECNFCAISVHQGRTVSWRSRESILKEAAEIVKLKGFRGTILDLGGPTANMYGFECALKKEKGACIRKRCLYPKVCKNLKVNHKPQTELLKMINSVPGVKNVFIASGIRHDLILADKQGGNAYLERILKKHTSGQMKIAPEHVSPNVLELMGKPNEESLLEFKKLFDLTTSRLKIERYLTYYIMAAHPGCTDEDMQRLKNFCQKNLKILPRQVQVFTPSPGTWSGVMFHTGINPFTGEKIFVEKKPAERENQKKKIIPKLVKK